MHESVLYCLVLCCVLLRIGVTFPTQRSQKARLRGLHACSCLQGGLATGMALERTATLWGRFWSSCPPTPFCLFASCHLTDLT